MCEVEKILCPKCSINKPKTEYYKGKKICKSCWNKRELQYRLNKEKNIKGEMIKIDKKTEIIYEKHSKTIEKELYDENRNFEYGIEDLEEEIKSLIAYFCRNVNSCLSDKLQIIENLDNNKIIKNIFDELEKDMAKLREMYIYEQQ